MLNDAKIRARTGHVSLEIATPAKTMPSNATTLLQCDADAQQKSHFFHFPKRKKDIYE